MPFIMQSQQIEDHIDLIDVQGWDFPHTTGVLIISGQETAIIETGHHRCGDQILTAMRERGIPFEDIRFVCVTHRHGDHCGGATPIATKVPNATVVGHKYAIKTLHDPNRLNQGARQLFGSFSQDIQPLPLAVPTWEVQNGDQFDLGKDVQIEIIETPGHTSDHLAYFESNTRTLYTGDAMGLLGPIRHSVTPTAFPPSFKFEQYKQSIEKLKSYDAAFLVFSHFGAVTGTDISVIFDRAITTVDSWKETVMQTWQEDPHQEAVKEAITQRFFEELEVFPPKARPLIFKMMAMGLSQSVIPNME